MDDAGWIERFIRHLEIERRLSPLTCKNYRRDLKSLVAFAEGAGLDDWSQLDSEHFRAFSASCYRKGLSPRSIQRLTDKYLMTTDPCSARLAPPFMSQLFESVPLQ